MVSESDNITNLVLDPPTKHPTSSIARASGSRNTTFFFTDMGIFNYLTQKGRLKRSYSMETLSDSRKVLFLHISTLWQLSAQNRGGVPDLGRRAAGSGGPMRKRSARQLLSSAGSYRRTALTRSDQATPPPECCRHAVVHARVRCADRLGAGALSERLRRLAFAQSELCRAVGPGKAGARSPPGSRNTGQGGHRGPKTCSEWATGVFLFAF